MRWIVYVDMDAFYVTVEIRDRPDLVGKKVIVGPDPKAGPTRGVVLSASYEARADGVRSAMPAMQAARLSPESVWIRADFEKYRRAAEEIRTFLRERATEVAPLSIDEAAIRWEADDPEQIGSRARALQQELKRELGLSASIGVSPYRVVAKIASDRSKPAGLVVVPPEGTAPFLAPLPVRAIPGVGPKTEVILREAGIETIGQIRPDTVAPLRRRLGGFADYLVALARGTPPGEEPFVESGPRSRSVDHTFVQDVSEISTLISAADEMVEDLVGSLHKERLRYQTVTVALRWADFARSQKSQSLPAAHEGPEALREAAHRLLREAWRQENEGLHRPVRTLSVRVERLTPALARQLALDGFDGLDPTNIK
jgi:nucleotidyltransferase/DNA polymerase involved in DNA repair